MLWKIAVLLLSFLFIPLVTCQAAWENLEFVDANGSTGYYVDRKSAYYPTENMAEAIVAVKKAEQNRMFAYRMRFDRVQHTYQILSSEILRYDTQETMEKNNLPQTPQTYRLQSPMSEIVDYLFAVKR